MSLRCCVIALRAQKNGLSRGKLSNTFKYHPTSMGTLIVLECYIEKAVKNNNHLFWLLEYVVMLKNARNLIPLTKDVLNNVNRPLIAPYCSPGYFSSGQKVGNVLYKWWLILDVSNIDMMLRKKYLVSYINIYTYKKPWTTNIIWFWDTVGV